MLNNRYFKLSLRLFVLLFIIAPLAAWFIVKPVRVIAPSLFELSCNQDDVCIEDPADLTQTTSLYKDALRYVRDNIGPMEGSPPIIFCRSAECANSFGLGKRKAVSVGTLGIIIAPEGWKPHFVRHELIHYLQGQRFGIFRRLLMPKWFIEGMAYSLSEDPRITLNEPWQSYRQQFNNWLAMVGPQKMWQSADQL